MLSTALMPRPVAGADERAAPAAQDRPGTSTPVFSQANLSAMPGWQLQGAGHPALASAMTALQGQRHPATGEWQGVTDPAQLQAHLQTIAQVRELPLAQVQADYQRFLLLARQREVAAAAKPDFVPGPFNELREGETRVPLLHLGNGDKLPDNRAHMASADQLRFGKLVGDALGVDAVFGALLSPTGGIAGAGNREVSGLVFALAGGREVVVPHGIAHDAGGYLLNHHQVGPGYHYAPGDHWHLLDRRNPLAGQVDGVNFFWNLRHPASPPGAAADNAP